MRIKIHTLLLFLVGWTGSLQSQSRADSLYLVQMERAEESVVLLKNKDGLLPLQRLDTLQVATVGLWMPFDDFSVTLNKYLPVDSWLAPAEEDAAAFLKDAAERYNLLILAIHAEKVKDDIVPPLRLIRALLEGIPEGLRVVTVVFGEGELWDLFNVEEYGNALLYLPDASPAHQSIAAQAIFGAVGARGRLAEQLGYHLPAGTGLTTPAGLRLRYSPPALVGMDAQLLEDSITTIVEEGIRAGAYPGAQVLVAKDGHVIWHRSFGYHTYDSLKATQPTDIYDFASVTKVTSALAALMKLHGEGRFELDAPLKRYFPDYKFDKSDKADLTFRTMLAHHARLRPWIPYWRGTLRGNARYPWQKRWSDERLNDGRFRWATFKTDSSRRFPIRVTDDLWLHRNYKKKIYKAIRKSPLREEPGFAYSGLLFYLLPEMVADLTGQDYETYLKSNFYHRLGAYTLTYNPLRFFSRERIVPTERDTFFRMVLLHGAVHDEGAAMMAGVSANAGLFGSANDLAKLMTMYMNYGTYGGEQFIAENTLREFTRCQFCEEDNHRGLGFDKPLIEYDPEQSSVAEAASPQSFGHSGYTGTFTWADPESGLLFIFMSNRVYPTRDNRKIYDLGIRPRLHAVLYEAAE